MNYLCVYIPDPELIERLNKFIEERKKEGKKVSRSKMVRILIDVYLTNKGY